MKPVSLIGCSGYYYNHWKGLFYPENLPKNKWLEYYSQQFNTVEINNTFYKTPDEKSVKNWYSITPSDFIFSVKGYRYFTHLKKLNTDEEFIGMLNRFQNTAAILKEKAGALLWQLPGNFPVNIERLKGFISHLSRDFHHVFEFRNNSWFIEPVYEILSGKNVGLCIVSAPSTIPSVVRVTSSFVYARFHGEGSLYRDNYSDKSIRTWKKTLEQLNTNTLYAYFNNDLNGYALNNALILKSLFDK